MESANRAVVHCEDSIRNGWILDSVGKAAMLLEEGNEMHHFIGK